MSIYSPSGNASMTTVQRNADRLEIPLPEPLVEAVASAHALVEKAGLGSQTADTLKHSVLGCMKKGRDYHTDPVVAGHLLDYVLMEVNLGHTAREDAAYTISEALNTHADTILADWSKSLEPDADALVSAAELIPTDDLNDGPTITKAGPQAVIAWSEALVARDRFRYAIEGFGALQSAVGVDGDRAHTLLADGAAAARIVTTRAKSRSDLRDAWHVARCGFRPVLPTISGYLERLGQAAAEQSRYDPQGE
ncbi:hypothetical protein [Mycobacteroides abscessus]|uniref:Uncharacterized protein n=1 Tax=Mycobacteroides abscessus TaxID=36809 RepID=A0A0U0ZRK9_9MYCO|nr:hypothetical protein [Mycobacteroides abscessus]MBL3735077.1 hypothetical protein [Mycobacteroides abscessus subsp. massiliense]MBL3746430.1 hypothetical protein [Mycobacteroides abscessus subsp. massiliense]MBL3758681.1 hypothetical protein [Mycobacteroides abscessus subsp. massiliense]MBN7353342.1 hypothetical protein [Mycobacteroides abscessus subsp. abscessus]MBN7483540.1 hypothetical protein [Mycobacteroides abscessus subsp. massiliense]